MDHLKHVCIVSFIFMIAAPARPCVARSDSAHFDASGQPPAIVIGFVGGYVNPGNSVHSEVQLADRLRSRYPVGVDVEVFENRHVREARRRILMLLTAGSHGVLTNEEKWNARVVLFGHSWGGAAVVRLARALQKDGVPVLLTVEVDAISKNCFGDIATIPANVREAANFYQPHGLIHGVGRIRAQDPSATRILGNFRFDYAHMKLRCAKYPWWDRYLLKAHTQIECDPAVWIKIESLIGAALALPSNRPQAGNKGPVGCESQKPSLCQTRRPIT